MSARSHIKEELRGRSRPDNRALGAFLNTGGRNIAIARPGDVLPGGGHITSVGFFNVDASVNDAGDVFFTATLDTDADHDGVQDSGAYVWSRGSLGLVARTGTVVPGVGTIRFLKPPGMAGTPSTYSGAGSNGRGQVLFEAAMTNGRGVLLVATPP